MATYGLCAGPMDRSAAIAILGNPTSTFTVHEPKVTVAADGFTEIALPQVFPVEDADEPAIAYEWACGGAALGAGCTAIEYGGTFSLVVVCRMHAV